MTDIAGNIKSLQMQIPSSVKLVAVSKTRPAEDIMEAYNAGQRCFGENRVQEILSKKDLLPKDIEWHLIGHLQTNKVRLIIPFITLIQSVDSAKLLSVINSEASKSAIIADCLLQVHIALEDTKFGFNIKEIEEMLESQEFRNMKNIRVCGLMGMATYTSDISQIGREFSYLEDCFTSLKNRYFKDIPAFKEISTGMSGDYKTALEKGSTILRIGTLIFGERNKIK